MLLDWNQQSFSQYESIIICIRLDLFSSEEKNVHLAHVSVWAFSYAAYSPREVIRWMLRPAIASQFCDNTATGEILHRFSVLLDRIYVERLELEQKIINKKRLLSFLPSLNIPSKMIPGSAH